MANCRRKKEMDKMEFLEMNLSIMAKLEMAKKFICNGKVHFLNGNLLDGRRRCKEWQYHLWRFQPFHVYQFESFAVPS